MCIEIQQIFFLENITVPGSYRNHSECVIKTTGEQPVNNGSCYVDCEYFFCTNRINKSTHLEIIVPCVQEFSLSPIHHRVIYHWDNIICVKRSQLLSWLACHFKSVIKSALLLECMLVCRGKAGFEDLHFIEGFPGVLEFTKLLFGWYFFSNCIQAALLNNSNVRWGRVCGPPT